MGKPTGFMEVARKDNLSTPPLERIKGFRGFHITLGEKERREQASRCMECGVPFCQSGEMISGMVSGCPLHNLVPETNDLVYRGNLAQAYERLSKTHNFPEFTSRVCPALCEAACTCGLHAGPVSVRDNERDIIEYAYRQGLVEEKEPKVRTGKTVAIVGSGPSGLAAASQLNRRGHKVTVFERNDRAGGLLRYGIPNMKLDKRIIDRRLALMEKAGIEFKTGVDVGRDISADKLRETFDAVVLACGASNPRDIGAPGRDAAGIYFAVDFLKEVSKRLMDTDYDEELVMDSKDFSFGDLTDKSVIIIGGGDTGNDCLGTAIRLGAGSVTQIEMMPKPGEVRSSHNPWPEWPKVLKTDYGQEEAIALWGEDPRVYQTTVTEFIKDESGHVSAVKTIELEPKKDPETGRVLMEQVPGTEKELKADLVLIAAGFLGSQDYVCEAFGVERDNRSNVEADDKDYRTSEEGVFAAGDMRRGQSLVVWAIAEGRAAAKAVDEALIGYTNL